MTMATLRMMPYKKVVIFYPIKLLRLKYVNIAVFSSKARQENHCGMHSAKCVISCCCFAEDSKEMYKDSKCTHRTIVLLWVTFPLLSPFWFAKTP